ncbi:hypothetical protein FI667_g14197, partial [Globisporangium splendens]
MLQRRQHKAQRRRLHGRNHETTNASRSNVRTKTEERHVLYLVIVVYVYNAIEIPDDIAGAADFTAALIVVASVFHIVDSARRSFVASLQSAEHTSNRDAQPGKENADESVCSAF